MNSAHPNSYFKRFEHRYLLHRAQWVIPETEVCS